jgi:histidyl-tRNA synthetase
MEKIQSIRGTKDILPDSINLWHYIFDKFNQVSNKFNYKEIRTPIFEKTEVFHRSIGEGTDIVNKEMYTFTDKGGESITLRPEATAAVVRSIVQNSILNESPTARLWYFGPFFRYERPQKGRLRQFHQYGAELIGSPNPEADIEIILLANDLVKSIGIEDYQLLINSLGNANSRKMYRDKLVDFLNENRDSLSADSQARLEINPLRILDSKDENDIELLANAPVILESLDEESKIHFDFVINTLDKLNIKYEINNRLVRGLDYYSHTVFEFRSNHLGSQDSFGGGGRYDNLIENLGGKSTPAIGFAFGIERLILILETLNKLTANADSIDYYILTQNSQYIPFAFEIAEIIRSNDKSAIVEIMRRSIKAQMREANKLNAKFAIIIGESEFENQSITIKDLTNSTQETIDLSKFLTSLT